MIWRQNATIGAEIASVARCSSDLISSTSTSPILVRATYPRQPACRAGERVVSCGT